MSHTDLFSLSDKIALVTGGNRGIGKMIAEGLLQAGATVYISSRKPDVGAQAAHELSQHGRCMALTADLSTEEGCWRLADAMQHAERLDILVNNAGATWGAPLVEFDEAAFEKVFALNVKGVFHLTKFLAPTLGACGEIGDPSRVINVGSIDGLQVPMLETYSYSASKAAVHQLTRHLAKRLAPRTTVNAIAPGPFATKMMAATLASHGERIASNAPLQRIGQPQDMAGAAVFLASRAGAHLTGVIIPVDGGISTTR